MKSVSELCKPRESVFEDTTRDDTLDLSNLTDGYFSEEKIDQFFNENFMTRGMKLLLDTAFDRFQGKDTKGVIKLTQAMGGGKTHSMITLALLARNLKWRKKLLGEKYDNVGDIKVITFNGRENPPYGIWGCLAEQLGKAKVFENYYAPLNAPGETAWIELLKGEKVLILLDELPPYLEGCKATTVGNSDLSQVTARALANLFVAISKTELANVCLVFSDLKATYESGSELLASSFKNLEGEADRVSQDIAPVALGSDEVYDILKKRLFKEYPPQNSMDVRDVALGYKEAVASAMKSGLTNYTEDQIYLGVRDSYPFHPSIKDLYARFRENRNFQQTRGLIRLMRQVVRQFYESGKADKKSLINVYDIDLNNPGTLSYIKQIKSSVENAINHDIAQEGKSIAEILDAEGEKKNITYAQDLAKLLLMSSLSDTPHGLLGLSDPEALGYLCEPGVELNNYKKAFEALQRDCWYIKQDNGGHLYFQETKNMVAQINTLVDSYSNEAARKDLRKFLENNFTPVLKSCYQLLYVLPAIDEINLSRDNVSLVILEPYHGQGLNPDIQNFYDNNAAYKNRVMFLTGQRDLMERLYENSKKLSAITHILDDMKADHLPTTDQQYIEADSRRDKAIQALLETIRQTFVKLYFPTKDGLQSGEFNLQFKENAFKGEEQIISVLQGAMKFENYSNEDAFMDVMRKKCETRLFTQPSLPWNQIRERAAIEPSWQWYHQAQLDDLKTFCIQRDKWREEGGYIRKGPFPKEPTDVRVEQTYYDHRTHEFTLNVRPIRGDSVFWDIGADPTPASQRVEMGKSFTTKETALRFRCYDTGADPHPAGDAKKFYCEVPIKHDTRVASGGNMLRLETHPDFEVRYTTDGSNPKENGGIYTGEAEIPENCKFVRVAVYNHGHLMQEKDFPVDIEPAKELKINPNKPLEYRMKSKKTLTDTAAVFTELDVFNKIQGTRINEFSCLISDKGSTGGYLEINSNAVAYSIADIIGMINTVRSAGFQNKDTEVHMDYGCLLFSSGEAFLRWVDDEKYDLNTLANNGEIIQ